MKIRDDRARRGVGKRIGRPVPEAVPPARCKPLLGPRPREGAVIAEIERVVITCPETHLEETRKLIANHGFHEARFTCIVGGTSRQESVYLGLGGAGGRRLGDHHEAVRPLVTVAESASSSPARIRTRSSGIPIPFTGLKGHDYVEDLLERDELVNVQLPQKFDRASSPAAHEAARREGTSFTEDASLFHHQTRRAGSDPARSERNIKITVPTDIVTARRSTPT
jgi:2-C-methyl-D-erythritol 4-phosphate cytidylyltransferase